MTTDTSMAYQELKQLSETIQETMTQSINLINQKILNLQKELQNVRNKFKQQLEQIHAQTQEQTHINEHNQANAQDDCQMPNNHDIQAQLPQLNHFAETFQQFFETDAKKRREEQFEAELSKITIFNGQDEDILSKFITTATIAESKIENEQQKNSFVDEIMRKTTIEVINIIHAYNGDNWIAIVQAIRNKYKHLQRSSDVLRSQIESLKQAPDESLHNYTERARKLVLERCRIHNSDEMIAEISHMAAKSLKRGLNNPKVREIAKHRATTTLDEVIRDCLEIESDINNEPPKIPSSELFCIFCKKPGHRLSSCRRKPLEGDDQILERILTAIMNMNVESNDGQNPNDHQSNNNENNNQTDDNDYYDDNQNTENYDDDEEYNEFATGAFPFSNEIPNPEYFTYCQPPIAQHEMQYVLQDPSIPLQERSSDSEN